MRYLVDTHIFVWWLTDDRKLKTSTRKIIGNKENQITASVVSGIEVGVKARTRRLKLKTTVKKMFEISGFKALDVNLSHVLELEKLPLHKDHKDPFDRLLIAQAKAEHLTLITADEKIWKYDISLLKA